MPSKPKQINMWILISLFSLLIWIIRWIPSSIRAFHNIVFVSWHYYYREIVGGWMYTLSAIGNITRLIAVITGITCIILIIAFNKNFLNIKKLVATALCLESIYFLLLIPSPVWLFAIAQQSRISHIPAISYILQISFTAPLLLLLACKILKQKTKPYTSIWSYVGLAFLGYVIALWAHSSLRWIDILINQGVGFFLTGFQAFGALNSLITMSVALVFASISAFYLIKKSKSGITWLALSLTMIGLHYTLYLLYSYLTASLTAVWLTDIWAIPLLGLGISILTYTTNKKNVLEQNQI